MLYETGKEFYPLVIRLENIPKTPPFQKGGRNGGVFECIVRNCCALVM